jgi:O-antigen ligase
MAFRDVGPQISSERLVTAHNEWLHQWFSYGLVGLLLCALIYVSFLWLLLRTRQDQTAGFERSLGFGLLAFSLIRGLFEAEMTGLIFPLPLFLLITLWLANLNLSGRTA